MEYHYRHHRGDGVFMLSGIRVVNQYQRGVVLTLGRFSGQRAPGLRG